MLTKDSSYVLLTQRPQQDFLFPEGGGGWRKTFKVFPTKILSLRRKFGSASLSDLLGHFKGPPEKQIPLRVESQYRKIHR